MPETTIKKATPRAPGTRRRALEQFVTAESTQAAQQQQVAAALTLLGDGAGAVPQARIAGGRLVR